MSTLTANFTPPIGHNNPPANTPEGLQLNLQETHADVLARAQSLIEAGARIPEHIDDEAGAEKITSYIAQVNACKKALEGIRVAEKEPYLTLGRVVDGFFKKIADPLEALKIKANRPLTEHLRKKADKERIEREERERVAREEAQAKLMAAQALELANQPVAAAEALVEAQAIESTANMLHKQAEAKPAELAKSRGEMGNVSSLRTVWAGELERVSHLELEALRYHIKPEHYQQAINSFVKAGGRELKGARIFEKSEAVTR